MVRNFYNMHPAERRRSIGGISRHLSVTTTGVQWRDKSGRKWRGDRITLAYETRYSFRVLHFWIDGAGRLIDAAGAIECEVEPVEVVLGGGTRAAAELRSACAFIDGLWDGNRSFGDADPAY